VFAGSGAVRGRFLANISGSYEVIYTTVNAFPLNTWAHFVGVFDLPNQTWTLYKNGAYNNGGSMTGSTVSNTNLSTRIGANVQGTPGEFFKGYIDELGLWNKALTLSEVQELYWAGIGNQYPFTQG